MKRLDQFRFEHFPVYFFPDNNQLLGDIYFSHHRQSVSNLHKLLSLKKVISSLFNPFLTFIWPLALSTLIKNLRNAKELGWLLLRTLQTINFPVLVVSLRFCTLGVCLSRNESSCYCVSPSLKLRLQSKNLKPLYYCHRLVINNPISYQLSSTIAVLTVKIKWRWKVVAEWMVVKYSGDGARRHEIVVFEKMKFWIFL